MDKGKKLLESRKASGVLIHESKNGKLDAAEDEPEPDTGAGDEPHLGPRDVADQPVEQRFVTDEVRHDRLRISDEIRNGLWFFEHSLFDAAEALLHEWRRRLPGPDSSAG